MEPEELRKTLEAHKLWLRFTGEGKQAQLEGANLGDRSDLYRANLKRAILNRANFANSDLTDTNFEGAELRRASFRGAILRRTNFRDADLQNADLEHANFLLTSQLAGADIAGTKLPSAIAEFKGLETIAEATSNAQKLFVAMLGACLYSWLTIGTTKDASLLTNSASSPLPIIGTALPIVGFYSVAPIVLVALYFYFHLNMQRLWEALADLPAVFPDGRTLDKRADPWLLNGLVSAYFSRLKYNRPALSILQQILSIFLAWCVVPVTLLVFWSRFLVRHDWFGTSIHIFLISAAIVFGLESYRLAYVTLRPVTRKRPRWKDWRTYMPLPQLVAVCVVGGIFYSFSWGAIQGIPYKHSKEADRIQEIHEEEKLWNEGTSKWEKYTLRHLVPRLLWRINFSPFADLHEEDISTKPANWTGKTDEYALVKGARLVDANMPYATATRCFLVNGDLRRAKLSWADLREANLSNADLSRADLTHANLSHANLSHANLNRADLTNASLDFANLKGANLNWADLGKAGIAGADFRDADLSQSDLRGVIFEDEHLDIVKADVANANLWSAHLKGVDPSNFKNITQSQIDTAITDKKTIGP